MRIKGGRGGATDPEFLHKLIFKENALRELDKAEAPDHSAQLVADAATAFFKVDTEVHVLEARIRARHSETKGLVAKTLLRYQKLVEEKNAKLQSRKLARAKVSEHTSFKIDDPRDLSSAVDILRARNICWITEDMYDRILATPEPVPGDGFLPAKNIATARYPKNTDPALRKIIPIWVLDGFCTGVAAMPFRSF